MIRFETREQVADWLETHRENDEKLLEGKLSPQQRSLVMNMLTVARCTTMATVHEVPPESRELFLERSREAGGQMIAGVTILGAAHEDQDPLATNRN